MHPVPLKVFARSLKGKPDEVWTKVLSVYHGTEKHTTTEWQTLLEALRRLPVSH